MRTRIVELIKPLMGLAPVLALLAATASAQPLPPLTPTPQGAGAWSYPGTYGPERWGEQPGSGLLYTGRQQTPLALWSPATLPLALAPPSFNDSATPLRMINVGYAMEFTYAPGSLIRSLGMDYRMAQFHFHPPASLRWTW